LGYFLKFDLLRPNPTMGQVGKKGTHPDPMGRVLAGSGRGPGTRSAV